MQQQERNNTLLYIGGGLLAWYMYRRFKLYQGIQFGVAGFGVKLKPLQLNIRMYMNNPTPVKAKLDGITGQIYQVKGNDESYVAQVNYNKSTIVAPYNRTVITLDIVPDVLGAIDALLNYKLPFRFVGSVVVDGIPLPINFLYTYDMLTNS